MKERSGMMAQYEINLNKTDNVYYMDCNTAIINGKRKLLHNEVGCSFLLEDGNIRVLSGWHIGTEDFEWTEDEGDFTWVLEKYHPGITEQLLTLVKGV